MVLDWHGQEDNLGVLYLSQSSPLLYPATSYCTTETQTFICLIKTKVDSKARNFSLVFITMAVLPTPCDHGHSLGFYFEQHTIFFKPW
jgi:hypothetical protein